MAISERGVQAVVCSVITNVIASIVVALRLWTRSRLLHIIGKEDWCILAALLFSWGNTIGNIFQVQNALGHHDKDLTKEEEVQFAKYLFGTFIVYRLALTMTKVSILFLYLRLFDVSKIRKACYIQLAIVIAYGIHLVLTTIFKCTPVQKSWNTHLPGHCINASILQYANAAINILTDFMILVLPLPVINALKLGKRQKISLYFIFALGFFVCIVSIIRLYGLHTALKSTDPAWDNTDVVIWSAIELNTGITCACLTTLKPLLSRLFPKFLSSSSPADADYNYRYQNSSRFRSGPLASAQGSKNRSAPLDSHSDTSILRSIDNFDMENLAGEGTSHNSKDSGQRLVKINAVNSQGFGRTVNRKDKEPDGWDLKPWESQKTGHRAIRVDTVVEQRFDDH